MIAAAPAQMRRRPPLRSDHAERAIDRRGDGGVENILRVAAEDHHADRENPQEHPSRAPVLEETVYREEDDRNPCGGDQPAEMARRDVQVMLAAEHPQHAAEEAREEVQPPPARPQIHEEPGEEDVQRDAGINCFGERQEEVRIIRRVQHPGLKAAEERRAAINVRVPEREVAPLELREPEFPPGSELMRKVRARPRENDVVPREKHVRENNQRKRRENPGRQERATGPSSVALRRRFRIEACLRRRRNHRNSPRPPAFHCRADYLSGPQTSVNFESLRTAA